MKRITFGLRFILFWLMPYAAIAAAIWGVGGNVKSSQLDFWYWGSGVRWAMFAALTCCWAVALGVTWASRSSQSSDSA